jgi:pimeloyl-ACP methyl ester carboxylesterase
MTDLLLVHGAWHGGWCWAKLRPILEDRGHRVWAPTFTGLGERVHLARRDTGLETHVMDLINVLEYEDLRGVVLIAHSYGGIPATVVADRCSDRLSAVIYLDSALPRDGQTGFDTFRGSEDAYREPVALVGDGWLIPPPDTSFGLQDAADFDWVRSRLTPHPVKTFADPIRLARDGPSVPVGAIICTQDATPDAVIARGFGEVPTTWITAGHDAMISEPILVADAIDEMRLRIS